MTTAITKMTMFGAFAMGTTFVVTDGPQQGTTGLIQGIRVESGYELSQSPRHFLVTVRTAYGRDVECYIRTID